MFDIWFPTVVYKFDNLDNKNKNKQISWIDKQTKLTRTYFQQVNTSHLKQEVHKQEEFIDLFKIIKSHLDIFLEKFGYSKEVIKKINVSQSWYNVSHENDYINKHIHPNSIVSGAFYLQSNENDKIFFHSQDDMIMQPDQVNPFSYKHCEYSCNVNRLLLFKSNVPHSTSKQIKGKKIVISFNTTYEI